MRLTITINGESVTLSGVTDGANIDLTPQSIPTVPTVPTVPEPIPTVPTVAEPMPEPMPEPTPKTTVAPRGVNRSDRKGTQGKPQSKTGPIKGKGPDPLKGKGKGKRTQSPLQAAGMGKTRHGRYGTVQTATDWLALSTAAVVALSEPQTAEDERKLATATERHVECLAQLRSEGWVSPKGKTVKA